MIILTTVYNCEDYIEKCINSIKLQTLKDFKCYLTDDMSTDNSVKKIKELIQGDDRFILIENEKKLFQVGNYDQVIRDNPAIDDLAICVELDGDDWFPDSEVLTRVQKLYSNPTVWLSNGSFQYHDGRSGFSKRPSLFKSIRRQTFVLSHLRTWRAFLWRKINQQDLKDSNGNYYDAAGDLAFMFPMFEMAFPLHYRFNKQINYIYNEGNPINEHKLMLDKIHKIAEEIRSKPAYSFVWKR